MSILRSRNGCPWDRAQTHASLKKHLIEEAYEVYEAISSKDPRRVKEELGDLLFQVIFHAQVADERGAFNINDILNGIYKKMLRRHPHVFGKRKASTPDEAYRRWQEKKDAENNNLSEKRSLLKGIPHSLPALIKAEKVLRRASWMGLDWPDIKAALEKVDEELRETKNALRSKNKDRIKEELGDLIFAIINLARFKEIDAEDALNDTIKKFARRFGASYKPKNFITAPQRKIAKPASA